MTGFQTKRRSGWKEAGPECVVSMVMITGWDQVASDWLRTFKLIRMDDDDDDDDV